MHWLRSRRRKINRRRRMTRTTVVIVVDKQGNYQLNQEPVAKEMLESRLQAIFATRAERVVFVKGDPELEFQAVAYAIDVAKGAGIDKVGIMTPKIEAGE